MQASQGIQNWLTECATFMASDLQLNMQWETPLGLVVRQPYVKFRATKAATDDLLREMGLVWMNKGGSAYLPSWCIN